MTAAQPLRIVSEQEVLAPVEADRLHTSVAAPGMRAEVQDAAPDDHGQALSLLQARSAGNVRPARQDPWRSVPTQVCRVAEVLHLPRYGALVRSDGAAFSAPIGGSLVDLAHLDDAPGMTRTDHGFSFAAPPDLPRIEGAAVFMPWGGAFNYGHFLLDALPSLLALEEAGLLGALAPVAPPLKGWQRELTALLLGTPRPVYELEAPAVHLDQAVYATSMDHFLHAPNALLLRVRERLSARAGAPPFRAARLYVSRRSHAHPMRILLNEGELERALVARGFTVVRPERLRPAQQIALAGQAEVVVGPTGAGMANALFARAGALVIDIQPQVFASAWVGAFGELLGHDWWNYYAPAPAPEHEVAWLKRVRRGFSFGYRLPLEPFLAFLDARL